MELRLAVIGGKQAGKEIPVRLPTFLIGRGEECQLRPQNHLVSRKHCAIHVEPDSVVIEDFGSTNGTFVNGERISGRHELKHGDHLKVAGLEFEVRIQLPVEQMRKAVAPTPKPSPSKFNDDLEISNWLSEGDSSGEDLGPTILTQATGKSTPPTSHDTIINHKPTDETTVVMPDAAKHLPKEKEKEKDAKKPIGKLPSHLKAAQKPSTENSRAAAEEMLRQFFPRKKP